MDNGSVTLGHRDYFIFFFFANMYTDALSNAAYIREPRGGSQEFSYDVRNASLSFIGDFSFM